MPEPLTDFTVIEMAVAIQGPAASLYLRDMGAEVIKIEPPIGDASRYTRGRFNPASEDALSPQFVSVNRGKRSLCLDAKTGEGQRVIHELLSSADVFLTNYREAALEQLGLDYETLHLQYPSLIYASVNGYGAKGPDADKAMLDGTVAARSGLVNATGYPEREPCLPGAVVIDTSSALQLALGVMTALLARERFGVAQRVQTSGLGASLWLQQWELTHTALIGADLPRDGNHHPNMRGLSDKQTGYRTSTQCPIPWWVEPLLAELTVICPLP
ncbi:MAG: CoA transferase [Pseudomonadota bacterium]